MKKVGSRSLKPSTSSSNRYSPYPKPPPKTSASPSPSASSSNRTPSPTDGFDSGPVRTRPQRAAATGGPRPSNADLFKQSQAAGLQDTHAARPANMEALRTEKDGPNDNLNMLAHYGSQAASKKGIFASGPLDPRGLGPQQVQTAVPDRDKGEHTQVFGKMTGGETSSTKYQQKLGTAEPRTDYEILHGMGHGEGGKKTQSPNNLASASHGANTAMIPPDKAISGNPDVIVDTKFAMRPGTQRAEYVDQRFFHKDFPDQPFFQQRIDGDRPKVTQSEYKQLKEQVAPLSDAELLRGAAHLMNFSKKAGSSGGDT
ncbi:hypothetical protein [Myxococcus sp. AB036A]|uniref:hypothetical protein n=1 Tax=Myxococcus sp. AB036A TaxID=2562793 RepID=UPI001E2C3AA3|nr:hypothetical protein [Myxococcus sp. AB036A]